MSLACPDGRCALPAAPCWGVLLVRPISHPPRAVPPRAADQRSRAYPTLLRVLRWGRYGHWGGPQAPEVGSLACVSRGPLSSRPPFRCLVCGGGFPVSPGGGWWPRWGAALRLSWPCCLCACPRLPWLWFAAGAGGWSPATLGSGSGSWPWLPATPGWGPLVLVGGGPSRLLAEVRRFAGRGPSLPAVGSGRAVPRYSWLRAPGVVPRHSWLGARWCWWWVAPRHSWLRVLGAVPRHSWLGSAGCGGGRFCGGFFFLHCASPHYPWVARVPRGLVGGFPCCLYLWLGACWCVRCGFVAVVWVWVCLPCVLARVRRRVAVCFPSWGLLLGVVRVGMWLVCGRPSPLLAEVPAQISPSLLAGFRCR